MTIGMAQNYKHQQQMESLAVSNYTHEQKQVTMFYNGPRDFSNSTPKGQIQINSRWIFRSLTASLNKSKNTWFHVVGRNQGGNTYRLIQRTLMISLTIQIDKICQEKRQRGDINPNPKLSAFNYQQRMQPMVKPSKRHKNPYPQLVDKALQ